MAQGRLLDVEDLRTIRLGLGQGDRDRHRTPFRLRAPQCPLQCSCLPAWHSSRIPVSTFGCWPSGKTCSSMVYRFQWGVDVTPTAAGNRPDTRAVGRAQALPFSRAAGVHCLFRPEWLRVWPRDDGRQPACRSTPRLGLVPIGRLVRSAPDSGQTVPRGADWRRPRVSGSGASGAGYRRAAAIGGAYAKIGRAVHGVGITHREPSGMIGCATAHTGSGLLDHLFAH